jgi:prepilin signal peptidase PulO-like enzyme (type II secretory pathway)
MKPPIRSSFVTTVLRIAIGYLLGRILYDLGRWMLRWLGRFVLLSLLGILAGIARE